MDRAAAVRLVRRRRLKAKAVADRRVETRTARMLRLPSELPRRRPGPSGKWSLENLTRLSLSRDCQVNGLGCRGDRCVGLEDAAVRAVPCALEGAWLPCVGIAFTSPFF